MGPILKKSVLHRSEVRNYSTENQLPFRCDDIKMTYFFPVIGNEVLLIPGITCFQESILNSLAHQRVSFSFSLFDFSELSEARERISSERFILRGCATMLPARNSSNVRCTSCIHRKAYSRNVARKLCEESSSSDHAHGKSQGRKLTFNWNRKLATNEQLVGTRHLPGVGR